MHPDSGRSALTKNDQAKQLVEGNSGLTFKRDGRYSRSMKKICQKTLEENRLHQETWCFDPLVQRPRRILWVFYFWRSKKKCIEFCWDVLPFESYFPDLAPSDHHLFRSLQNPLDGKHFKLTEALRIHLLQPFCHSGENVMRKFFICPKYARKYWKRNS